MIKSLLIVYAIFFLARAQLNQTCSSNATCQNLPFPPCTSTGCICDPLSLTCKLSLGQPCINGQGYCQIGTVCVGGICLATDSQPCSSGLCILGGNCINGKCRAAPGYAWDPVNAVYSPCSPTCATCFTPNDPSSCLTCTDSNKYATSGICVCSSGASSSNGACLACDPICATCAVPQSPFGCTSCALASMTLISGLCFCPVGMAWNPTTLACENCDSSCLTCTRPGSPNFCTSCVTGTLVGGTCSSAPTPVTCRPGTAPNANGICLPCHCTCKTCLAPSNPNRCTSCKQADRLVGGMCVPFKVKYKKLKKKPVSCPSLMASINGVCKCIRGYVGNSLSPTTCDTYCMPCDPSCLTCYEAQNPSACTSCQKGLFLVGGICTINISTPPSSITCSPICLNCTTANNPYECVTCAMSNSQQRNGFCYCAAGSYNFSNVCIAPCDYPCSECFITNSSICTACPVGLIPLGGTCVCPSGTAFNSAGVCAPCDVSCLSCAQAGNILACTTCTDIRATLTNGQCVCPDPLMSYNSSGLCSCPAGTLEVGSICISSLCPPGTFPVNGDCVACTLPNCANCSSLTTCTECNPGYYLLFNGLCAKCPATCLTCSSASLCTSCLPGYILDSFGRCVRSCPACCPTCTINSLGQVTCLSCLNNFIFLNSQCLTCSNAIPGCVNCKNCACTKCAAGYFLSNSTKCTACGIAIPNCEVCTNSNTCLRCTSPFVFDAYQRKCVIQTPPPTSCPDGTYMDRSGICLPCYTNCKKCVGSGLNMCTECYPGSILYPQDSCAWGRCVCKGGQVFDHGRKCCQPATLANQGGVHYP